MSVSEIGPADDEEDVDVDVDLDAMAKEATGEPTRVRLDGRVIHVMHAGDWNSSAMRAASAGDWDTWAREVIEDDEEYQTWEDANLKNTQIEAVFAQCGRQARMSAGKSQRRSGSRRSTRTR
ncbi:MAG TPA: hypothetical protein VNS88_15650 [Nitrospiraceae bacterium]|nr:hypothetical protein [Nitrospiraceae bacterium]